MNIETKDALACRLDDSKSACATRLRAARLITGYSQKEAAQLAGVGATSWNNAEAGRNYPSLQAMRWLFRAHRIDFNFLIAGEFAQLPGDVQDRLFAVLAQANELGEQGQRPSSDRYPHATATSKA